MLTVSAIRSLNVTMDLVGIVVVLLFGFGFIGITSCLREIAKELRELRESKGRK